MKFTKGTFCSEIVYTLLDFYDFLFLTVLTLFSFQKHIIVFCSFRKTPLVNFFFTLCNMIRIVDQPDHMNSGKSAFNENISKGKS